MTAAPAIWLAASEGVGLDVIIWLVIGAIWLMGQVAAAGRRKARRQQAPSREAEDTAAPGAGRPPAPDELTEIFRRLGADIPATPPPQPPPTRAAPEAPRAAPPRPAGAPRSSAYQVREQSPYRRRVEKPYETKVQPDIARRLARAKKESAEAARLADIAGRIPDLDRVQGVDIRRDDSDVVGTATQTSGLVLPRLHAMALRLYRLPSVPMPSLSTTHHEDPPLRIRLTNRRELRDAVVAQALLHPPKSQAATL